MCVQCILQSSMATTELKTMVQKVGKIPCWGTKLQGESTNIPYIMEITLTARSIEITGAVLMNAIYRWF